MTTLAVQGIQAFARGGVRAVTSLALNTATGFITRALDNRVFEGPRLESFHLQTSRDGAPMPRIFGRMRLAGQVIWASQVRETVTEEEVGGKGGPSQRNYSYTISFAVGLCEGEILGVDRIWANGEILPLDGLTVRIHTGSESQGPDSIIAATESGDVPAFRGTAYMVFEDFPLDDYGTRLPLINAEVVRRTRGDGGMEQLIRSVNLLPGTGEFALSPTIVEEAVSVGQTKASNMNSLTGQADLLTSLDQLQAELPNVEHVSIITSWFGSSLDCAECDIQPGIETPFRQLPDRDWSVAGRVRGDAYVVSADEDGRPNYGGTPSDDSLIDCITELRQRGLAVTLYPFILMDTPDFPWRGRISSANNGTDDVIADIEAFFGTDEDFRFRHHILHYARLASEAGGVDAIVIGTELRALMALRDGSDNFPAVAHMRTLAADVRAIVGPSVRLTYAADWSDYFGHHDGDNVFYHLDPLWADDNIDAIGIDAYFPLSDWRDGGHLDAVPGRRIHDLDYLASNVESGEGYQWFYASSADREAQIRSPITDGAYGKPWVFRYKDMRNWWGNPHVERRGGVETNQSPWVPKSKPIWLLEYGCPAVDKGANQPNLFLDYRSVDSGLPYFSSGARDDLIQRRYIEAFLGHYETTNEDGFLDLTRASCWTWDARPFPDFPARADVWSDGRSWSRGHWLNGRTGLMPVADIINELVADSGLLDIDISGVSGVIPGYQVDRPMTARAALDPLLQLYDIEMGERDGRLVFAIGGPTVTTLDPSFMVANGAGDGGDPVQRSRADPENRIRDVRLTFIDAARDYQLGSASARELSAQSVATIDLPVPASLDEGFAKYVATRELSRAHTGEETVRFSLPLETGLGLHVGDRFHIAGDPALWAIESLDLGSQVDIGARRDLSDGASLGLTAPWVQGPDPAEPPSRPYVGAAQLFAFDLPGRSGVSAGAILSPFEPVELSAADAAAQTSGRLFIGATLSPLPKRSPYVRDRSTKLDIILDQAVLSSKEEDGFMERGNRFAVETSSGWEIIAARDAQLIAASTYHLSNLLRGLNGSARYMDEDLPAGARIVWLDRGIETLPVSSDWRGETLDVSGGTATRDARPAELIWNDRAGEPLSPVQARWDGTTLSWIGRDLAFTDWSEEAAHLTYRLVLTRGALVDTYDLSETELSVEPFDSALIYQIGADGRLSPALEFTTE